MCVCVIHAHSPDANVLPGGLVFGHLLLGEPSHLGLGHLPPHAQGLATGGFDWGV